MFCPNCGTSLEEGTIFCVNCGARLADFEDPNAAQNQNSSGSPYGYEDAGRQGYQEPYGYEEEPGYEDGGYGYGRPPVRQQPKSPNNTLRNGIIAAVIIAAAGVAAFFGIRYFMGDGSSPGEQSAVSGGTQNGGGEGGQNIVVTGLPTQSPSVEVMTPVPTAAPTSEPAVTAAPTTKPTASPTPTATPEPKPTVTSEPTPTVKPSPKPTQKPTTAPSSSGTNLYVLKPTEGLNIRSISDYNSTCLFTVYGSTPMVFRGVVETGYGSDGAIHDWYQVEVSKVQGWVRSDLVLSTGDGYYVKNVEGAMNMRCDHSYNSDIAGTVFDNMKLRYTGQTGTGYGSDGQIHDWLLVETQTITGWVRGDLTYS